MTDYDIYVHYADKTTKKRAIAFEGNLTYSQVEKIADQYQKGKKFLFNNKPTNPFDVEEIRIYDRTTIPFRLVTRHFIQSAPEESTEVIPRTERIAKVSPIPSKNIFIVHGRDHTPLEELKGMLQGFGLNPVVLHEEASGSRTIVEKLEKYLDEVGYAFVILTPDDFGCLKKRFINYLSVSLFKEGESESAKNDKARFFFREVPKLLMNRARQNVVLEFGCCIAKLGRERVCCLHKSDIELPSDMHGIVYIPFKNL